MNRADRTVTLTQLMEPQHANVLGSVHGGEIMRLMDTTAGLTAAKYSGTTCVAARVDELQFLKPVYVGSFLSSTGSIVYTGNSSIVIHVTVDSEDIRDKNGRYRALDAFFTYVALGQDGKPTPVPRFSPETETEKEMYEYIKQRRDFDRQRREISLKG